MTVSDRIILAIDRIPVHETAVIGRLVGNLSSCPPNDRFTDNIDEGGRRDPIGAPGLDVSSNPRRRMAGSE